MDDEEAPRSIDFHDAKLSLAFDEFLERYGFSNLDKQQTDLMCSIFQHGWGACMNANFRAGLDLALLFIRMREAIDTKGGERKLVLSAQVVDVILELCHALVGNPEIMAMHRSVEVVEQFGPEQIDQTSKETDDER